MFNKLLYLLASASALDIDGARLSRNGIEVNGLSFLLGTKTPNPEKKFPFSRNYSLFFRSDN
ncbi:hypothetical protein LEP1GSC061_3695 [Leptospira wolffii serovar Khorat str. Khorat-H2]|nr:hypothetical protein LEP1GSC061_3695 [Leptospira wolffii serovar Khorat str. Khorat-H2]